MSDDSAVERAKNYVTPDELPSWLDNPDQYIRSRITAYLLSLIAALVAYLDGVITDAFGAVEQAFAAAGGSFEAAWRTAMVPLLEFFEIYQTVVADVAGSMGPFGPIFAAVVVAVSIVILWRLIVAILDSIPGVQGIVTFFRGG